MIRLTEKPIDTTAVLESVVDERCGAEVLFVGTTRRWTTHQASSENHQERPDLETEYLIYEAYEEMAISQLQSLAELARQKWPIEKVAIAHRLGKVLPCEASVAVAVSSPHRSEAFEAAEWLIDTIKHEVPIWKQEHYVQSGPEWIHPTSGNCNCKPAADQFSSAPAVSSGNEALPGNAVSSDNTASPNNTISLGSPASPTPIEDKQLP